MGKKTTKKPAKRGGDAADARRWTRRRKRRWIVGILAGLLLIGGGVWLWNGARATPPEPAPRFNLWASTGRVITLDDYLGKQEVVLFFFMGAG
ncbi:MAG: hypothetical protein HY726_07400 [Candidatus Rokubacteria bacterium]|nr:hypothetical protein [Candidatus Rokubacteria bacterium]